MTPTPKLRYVEREVRIPICEGIARCEHHKFLQQWWTSSTNVLFGNEKTPYGEWRDIPVEIEHD